jgi:hypothetical protein
VKGFLVADFGILMFFWIGFLFIVRTFHRSYSRFFEKLATSIKSLYIPVLSKLPKSISLL